MNYSIDTMKIHQIFFKNTLRNFCYLISFDDGTIYCIDPLSAPEVTNYLKIHLNNGQLKGIINTHDHCDHFSGNEQLVTTFHCAVMSHPKADIPMKNRALADNEVIHQAGEWTLKVLYTPGHTLTHLALLLEQDQKPYAIFTGDCFFNAGVGNCHNGGDPEVLYHTISSVFQNLADEVLVYPGHEYLKRNLEFTKNCEPHNDEALSFLKKIESVNLDEIFFVNTMKTERKINTFLRLTSPDLIAHLKMENSSEKKIFLTLREMRNRW